MFSTFLVFYIIFCTLQTLFLQPTLSGTACEASYEVRFHIQTLKQIFVQYAYVLSGCGRERKQNTDFLLLLFPAALCQGLTTVDQLCPFVWETGCWFYSTDLHMDLGFKPDAAPNAARWQCTELLIFSGLSTLPRTLQHVDRRICFGFQATSTLKYCF